MTITATIIGKKHNAAIVKIVGTAAADTATVSLKTTITTAPTGNIVFDKETATITRADAGSWITDGVTVGSVLVITGTTNNNDTFIVKSVTALVITIEENTSVAKNNLVDETTGTAVFTGSYKSDLLSYGQIISGTPEVNIARARYSVSSSGDVTVVRDSVTILKLFGHDEIECPTHEKNTFDIVVTFNTSAGGTLILEVTKGNGWSAINPAGLPY